MTQLWLFEPAVAAVLQELEVLIRSWIDPSERWAAALRSASVGMLAVDVAVGKHAKNSNWAGEEGQA